MDKTKQSLRNQNSYLKEMQKGTKQSKGTSKKKCECNSFILDSTYVPVKRRPLINLNYDVF